VRRGQPPVLRAEPRECREVRPGREGLGVEPCSINLLVAIPLPREGDDHRVAIASARGANGRPVHTDSI
jgi:hypothetical protein